MLPKPLIATATEPQNQRVNICFAGGREEMASVEERMKVLKMIEEGKITAEEGAKLLAALDAAPRAGKAPASSPPVGSGRWLRVRVTDITSGRPKVNVTVPIGLVSVGLKMGARFAPQTEGLDWKQISEVINSGMVGKIIDVVDEQDGEHVEIFVE
ncbi:MAG: SHOCT-like domain-containing protein [Anaerolineae bacterium]